MSQAASSTCFVWDRESLKILILMYEANPNLYQTQNPDYKLKNKRLDSLNHIKTSLFENGFFVSIEDINKKIHNLRTQFFKEYGKVKKPLVSGAGTADLYIPKVWWYELLTFLINSDPVRKSRSNLPSNLPLNEIDLEVSMTELDHGRDQSQRDEFNTSHNQQYEEMSESEDIGNLSRNVTVTVDQLKEGVYLPSVSQNQTKSSLKRKRRTTNLIEEDAKTILKDASNVLNVSSSNRKQDSNDDEFQVFAKLVAEEIKNIGDVNETRRLKRQILDCIYDAQERIQQQKCKNDD